MLPFGESFASIEAALVAPALVGLLVSAWVARLLSPRYFAAFALGIYFWFFSDTIGGSSYLDVNSGFAGGLTQVALVALFALGVLLFFWLDRDTFEPGPTTTRRSLTVPLLVAFAVGIHGFGEGAAFSATAAATTSTNLFDAFGGVTAAVAFVLHKGIEPMMVGAAYWIYSKDRADSGGALAKDVLLLTLVFVLPGTLGAATDYFLNYDTTYLFALGTGTSIYAAVRLAKPLFWDSDPRGWESFKVALLMVLGFLCIYFAALFHS
jgi:zinc transporter ZupT